jgi:predicted phage terminase large subunit-like protein
MIPTVSPPSSPFSPAWVRSLPEAQRLALARALQPRLTRYIPHQPTPKQAAFLLLPHLEAFYGGAGGGGKSEALLMAALQYVDVPGYAALILRRSFTDLSLPGALMDRAHEWLDPTDATWHDRDKTWSFPSGATLTFGYLELERDKYRYQSAELHFVAFDELTEFSHSQFRFLFSRLRRKEGVRVPLRMRAASNPGGLGHDWVKQRYGIGQGGIPDRPFIPARLEDNPHIDREAYERSLAQLDPVTRAQIKTGDWSVRQAGALFQREWFEIVEAAPAGLRCVRFWDLASTDPKRADDPDWTAGAKVGERDGVYYIMDVRRRRARPLAIEQLVRQTAELDGRAVEVVIEQEPGSSGVNTIEHYQRRVLKGFTCRGHRTSGSKVTRAAPVASAAEAGNVKLVRGPWIEAFLDELEAFPLGAHDDQVDALSGAVEVLARPHNPQIFA